MKDLLEKIALLKVVVIGDLMLDHYIRGDTARISPEAPVPVVVVDRDTYAAGGAANVAVNVRTMGAEVELCGLAGDDEAGERLIKILAERQVAFDSAFVSNRHSTIVKTRIIARHQQLCRFDREAPPSQYASYIEQMIDTIAAKAAGADVVIISDYAKGIISPAMIAGVQTAARSARTCLVALDPKPKRQLDFSGLDLITPNRLEAIQMAGMEFDPYGEFPDDEVCRRIWERYHTRKLIVTLGSDGLLIGEEGRVLRRIPTYAREVYDVSGAGDTVISASALALAGGANLERAAHLANVAAGIVVAKVGAATAGPDEILEYEARHS